MDAHRGEDEGNLSDFERRLARWRPESSGLDADAAMFAAGAASVERGGGQRFWPASCGLLVALAAVLGTWALIERAERQLLASHFRERAPAPQTLQLPADSLASQPVYSPSPRDYFHLRRRAEQDTSYSLASLEPTSTDAVRTDLPERAILQAGQWGSLLD